jgi:SAM-dependent methyltransferase
VGIDYSVTFNRSARVDEAIQILNSVSHDCKNGRLLDLGCGNGDTTKCFFMKGVDVVGLEVNPIPYIHVPFVRASGLKLPFKDGYFNTVILNDVLEHVRYVDAVQLFNEISRVLTVNGFLYVSVASKFEFREPHSNKLFLSWLPRFIYAPVIRGFLGEDVYPYTVRQFRGLTEESNFTFDNFTGFYVAKKVADLSYVGNTILRPLIGLMVKLKLTGSAGLLRCLEPFGVLVFVCKKTGVCR